LLLKLFHLAHINFLFTYSSKDRTESADCEVAQHRNSWTFVPFGRHVISKLDAKFTRTERYINK
jgi:hypothetical protein